MMARQMVNFVYLIGDRSTGEAVVVDPAYAVQDLLDIVAADGMQLTGVLGTHFHPDHLGGTMAGWSLEGIEALLEKVSVPIHVQADEVPWVERTTGVGGTDLVGHHSGDVVGVGGIDIELIHTPGHTPGSRASSSTGAWWRGTRCSWRGAGAPTSRARTPRHVRVDPHPPRPGARRRGPVPGPPVLGRALPEHGTDPAVELRLPPPLRAGVDGDVRRLRPAMSMETVIVVGASLAGWRATEGLRAEGYDGTISLVGLEPHLPYDRPPLSKQILAGTWPPEKAVLADKKRSSELHRGVRADKDDELDITRHKVELDNQHGALQAAACCRRGGTTALPGTEHARPGGRGSSPAPFDDSSPCHQALGPRSRRPATSWSSCRRRW